jgi:hypothetical protein
VYSDLEVQHDDGILITRYSFGVEIDFMKVFFSPLFNQVGQLRTSFHLQLQPGQDRAKQCDTKNTEGVLYGIEAHLEVC